MPDGGRIPGAVVIPNCVLTKIVWNLANGKQAVTDLHGTVSGAFSPTPAVCDAIKAALTTGGTWTAYAGFLPTTVQLAKVQIVDLRSSNNAVVESSTAAAPGTSASGPLAAQTAFVLTKKTAKAGPGFRGRAYLPGLAQNAIGADGRATGPFNTAANNFALLWRDALNTQAITYALAQPARQQYNGSTGTLHPARAAATQPLISFAARNTIFDTQRRRAGKT